MKEIRHPIFFYRDGLGSFRFRGMSTHHGMPPAVKDLYVEKASMGNPPAEATLIIQWEDAPKGEDQDDGT